MSDIANPRGVGEVWLTDCTSGSQQGNAKILRRKKGETMAKAKAVKKGKKLGSVKPLLKIHPQTKMQKIMPLTRIVK